MGDENDADYQSEANSWFDTIQSTMHGIASGMDFTGLSAAANFANANAATAR